MRNLVKTMMTQVGNRQRHFSIKLKFISIISIVFTLTGCFMSGGGGSDTEVSNNTVSGIIHTSNPHSSMNAKVWLIPVNYRAPIDSTSLVYETSLDQNGNFQFLKVDTGTYNLEALDAASGDRLLLRHLKIKSSITLQTDSTQATGSLAIILADSSAQNGGNIYITGFLGQWPLSPGQRKIILDSLPVGLLPDIHFLANTGAPKNILLADSTTIIKGDTAIINAFSLWKYSAQIFITPKANATQMVKGVGHFPILLRLTSSDLDFKQALPNGADLRFTNAKGEALPFAIENWDAGNSVANLWINVDTIDANNDKQFIRVHWGKTDAGPVALNTALFDTTSGYAGVWHMDNSTGQSKILIDASERKNDQSLISSHLPNFSSSGVIGSALNFDGVADHLISSQYFDSPQIFTISLWFKTTNKNGGYLIDFSRPSQDTTKRDHDRQIWMDDKGKLNFGVFVGWGDTTIPSSQNVKKVVSSLNVYNDGAWHWVSASLSPKGQMLYVDGELVSSDPATTTGSLFKGRWTLGYEEIGDWTPYTPNLYFEGMIDEVQVVHRDLGVDWLRLQYHNQSINSTLLHFVH